MPGWNLKSGVLNTMLVSEDEYWSLFNFVFSDSCMKRNTYKFGLIKSIMDNLFNSVYDEVNEIYRLSYDAIFEKFTVNYWNLVLKYHLKQMRSDGRTEISKIESILMSAAEDNNVIRTLNYESLAESDKNKLIKQVSASCRRNVVGALYNDMEGKLYGFDLKADGIVFAIQAYEFMLKYKAELEKLNYYAWAKFMERINDDDVLVRVLEKLELSTPKRDDLSIYREVVYREFEECNCFYCGKRLNLDGRGIHVDHFIPWSFIKDDKLWNFVLSCPACNEKKNNKIPSEEYLKTVIDRNERIKQISSEVVQIDFENYNPGMFKRMWMYVQFSGMKKFSLGR